MERLTSTEIAQLREMFNIFDKNDDASFADLNLSSMPDREGFITCDELGTVLESLGQNPTQVQLQNLISEFDADKNGAIDFPEFLNLMTSKTKANEKELREAFSIFDKDQDGFISVEDLRQMMTNLGQNLTDDELNEMIRESDMDGVGQISYDEFVMMMEG